MISLISSQPKKNVKTKIKELAKIPAKIDNYKIEETIGEGTYGKVKLATHIKLNEKVAIKFINKKRLTNKGDDERIKNEIKIITKLNHPNILKAFEVFEDDINYYIVMERPIRGDLFNYICSKGRLTMDEASFIFYQLVNGIQYLHKNNVVHRDMKPENIMLTKDMIVKIGDFGLSKFFKSTETRLKTNCGSPCYSAPEVLRGNRYKPKPVDIWGLGIILYCMVCGELPFEDDKEDILVRKVTLCKYTCPLFVNDIFKNFFKKILCPNPNERITIEQIKMNCIYNVGRSNFYKYFKIYGDDGDMYPQVKNFIKKKVLKNLEVLLSLEISEQTEQMNEFKILMHKYMHDINWHLYYIPKNNGKKVKHLTEEQLTKLKNSVPINNIYIKTSSSKQDEEQKNTEENTSSDILFIPEHKTINEALFPKNKKSMEKFKISKEDIDGIRKLGIISHSFDYNLNEKHETKENSNILNKEQETNI